VAEAGFVICSPLTGRRAADRVRQQNAAANWFGRQRRAAAVGPRRRAFARRSLLSPRPARAGPAVPARREAAPQSPAYGAGRQPLLRSGGAAADDQGAPQLPRRTAGERINGARTDSAHLDPYGNGFEDEKYGPVWVPNRDAVGEDFDAYVSSGTLASTEDGDWRGRGDYPFGGFVFPTAVGLGARHRLGLGSGRVCERLGNLACARTTTLVGWPPCRRRGVGMAGRRSRLVVSAAALLVCAERYAFSDHVHLQTWQRRYVIQRRPPSRGKRSYAGTGGDSGRVTWRRSIELDSELSRPRWPTLQSDAHPGEALCPQVAVAGSPCERPKGPCRRRQLLRSGGGSVARPGDELITSTAAAECCM